MSAHSTRIGVFASIFGAERAFMYEILQSAVRYANGQTYSVMNVSDFEELIRTQPRLGQQIYWRELVGRAHFAATSSALRHLRWLDATLDASVASNYLGFCGAFRSLLESVADSLEALQLLPRLFATNGSVISRILRGDDLGKDIHTSSEAEEALIHFSHGRKSNLAGESPKSHRARSNRDYLNVLEQAKLPQVHECYSELCDVCHPASLSLFGYIRATQLSDCVNLHIDIGSDAENIETFLDRYSDLKSDLLVFAINPILLMLHVINKLRTEWQCSMVSDLNLSGIPEFRRIESLISTWE